MHLSSTTCANEDDITVCQADYISKVHNKDSLPRNSNSILFEATLVSLAAIAVSVSITSGTTSSLKQLYRCFQACPATCPSSPWPFQAGVAQHIGESTILLGQLAGKAGDA